jgi:hypothetical protein
VDDIKEIALRVTQNLSGMDEREQYGILFDALEAAINDETDKQVLAIMAAQLSKLADNALIRSGYEVIADTQSDTIN